MCGIAGYTYHDTGRSADRQVLAAMNAAITHRGPDSDGFHFDGPTGIAMRRLAIIDVASGRQPISNEDGSIWIVFNGEIYNHPALRAELEKRGHIFKTHSDTESIVHAYEEYGDDCVRHLRGMFAFAIWDAPKRRLFIARDRLGKKPLYYAEHDGALLFGSELKCLLKYPGFPREMNPEAVHHYLTLQYVPDPLTGFRAAKKLPPAHTLVCENGRISTRRYWDIDFRTKESGDDLREHVRTKIEEAVRIRLMSEVPLGAHLSGGIDSSVVVGLMAGMSSRPVKTFSIGFEEAAFNETDHARAVAEKFGTEHQEFIVAPSAMEVLGPLGAHFDEPFADSAAIPLWYLSKLTRQHVTVALNGDGGDEAFAGYQRYYADAVANFYGLVPSFLRNAADALFSLLPVNGNKPVEKSPAAALRKLGHAASFGSGASVVRWGSYFSEAEKAALYTGDFAKVMEPSHGAMEQTYAAALAGTRVDRTLYTDLHHYLPGALLVKADRVTMAHSLEARSPFLDHELMELAARLPVNWKIRGTTTKWILRDLFRDFLPERIAGRGKLGFSVPLARWFAGPNLDAVRDLLGSGARCHGFLSAENISKLIEQNRSGRFDHGKKIWALLVLENWLRSYAL
ncbi:MAG: Asparagine synthetase [Verrucomicrobiota bacterium]|jgi:asparagine synthase (glutamine-hydrolysing)